MDDYMIIDETLMQKYENALENLEIKFKQLYRAYEKSGKNNPIEHLKFRIKTIDSIAGKVEKINKKRKQKNPLAKEYTIEEGMEVLNDIVGVRIICSFLSDIKTIIKFIEEDPEIEIINRKNYIEKPKENSGYRSYHLIVKVPVRMNKEIIYVNAEIQVRTIVMDMWASLEHKIWYKKGIELSKEFMDELNSANITCINMDYALEQFMNMQSHSTPPSNDIWIEKMQDPNFKFLMYKYSEALKLVEQKLKTISGSYDAEGLVNPIEHIKSRLKSPSSIDEKLRSHNQEFTISNIESYVNDIAAIRIVCSFRSDVEKIIEILKNDHEIINIHAKEKDYITNPKDSGYMGYHLLVWVPVHLRTDTIYVKVEIQIRTIAMEMWASVEHKLCYKNEQVDPAISTELKRLSNSTQVIDKKMDNMIEEVNELLKQKRKRYVKRRELLKCK